MSLIHNVLKTMNKKWALNALVPAMVGLGIIRQDQATEDRLQEGGGKRGLFRMHGGPMLF